MGTEDMVITIIMDLQTLSLQLLQNLRHDYCNYYGTSDIAINTLLLHEGVGCFPLQNLKIRKT